VPISKMKGSSKLEYSAFNYIGQIRTPLRTTQEEDSDEIDKEIDKLNKSLPLEDQLSDIEIEHDFNDLL
jgi:hypothetical protein